MSNIYLMFVDDNAHSVDWITYSRASMLHDCLPNCAGVFRLSDPPKALKTADEGWVLYLLCHGDDTEIGGFTGKALAEKVSKVIPADKLGMIHIQSCATGDKPAAAFAAALGKAGHQVIVKAPVNNATFTDEIGFLVLEKAPPKVMKAYKDLRATHESAGSTAAASPPKGDLLKFCDNVHKATKQFWTDFSKLFKGIAFPTGQGWNAYQTEGKGAKKL
jgi:hypothetical protein